MWDHAFDRVPIVLLLCSEPWYYFLKWQRRITYFFKHFICINVVKSVSGDTHTQFIRTWSCRGHLTLYEKALKEQQSSGLPLPRAENQSGAAIRPHTEYWILFLLNSFTAYFSVFFLRTVFVFVKKSGTWSLFTKHCRLWNSAQNRKCRGQLHMVYSCSSIVLCWRVLRQQQGKFFLHH